MLGMSGENTERRRLIRVGERGLLDFSRQLHVGLVGFARFTPGAGKRAWPFVLTRFHSPRSWSPTHLNDDLFHFRCRSLICYYYYYYYYYYAQHVGSVGKGRLYVQYSYRVS